MTLLRTSEKQTDVGFSHLVSNDVNLVLHLRNPLTDDGEQLRDGGPRVHEDLLTGRVIWVEEGERWRQKHPEPVNNRRHK